jgi:hypothetical protein
MEMAVEDVRNLTPTTSDPSTLGELLTAGKKVPPEPTSFLMQDHAEARALFAQYDSEDDDGKKSALAMRICAALTVHAQIEEEIFYPEAGTVLEDDEVITAAVEEHGEAKEQIARIVEGISAGKSIGRDVKKLRRLVEHHVQEEESGMLPDVRQVDPDLYEIGAQLAARRLELLRTLWREAANLRPARR